MLTTVAMFLMVLLLFGTLLVAIGLPLAFLLVAYFDHKRRKGESDSDEDASGGGGWRDNNPRPGGGPGGGGDRGRTVEEFLMNCIAGRTVDPVEMPGEVAV
jgi:hypothetical protein